MSTQIPPLSRDVEDFKLNLGVYGVAAIALPVTVEAKPKRKPSKTSPTQRSLKHMRDLGYTCAIVEKWNQHARIRQDMFGFIDIVCIKDEDIVGVQACAGDGGASAERVRKIAEHENWPLICNAIRVVVQSWRKNAAGKWTLREVEL
jgi:hypothetical protein